MLDIADRFCFGFWPRFEQLLEARLSLAERQLTKVFSIGEQQIEGIENQIAGLAVGNSRLQRRKIRRAVLVKGYDFAVDESVGKLASLLCDRRKLFDPIQALARLQARLAILDAQLNTIAVELDFVAPALPTRRALDRGAEFGGDEIRHVRDLARSRSPRGRRLRWLLARSACLGRLAAVRMPNRIGLSAARSGRHEWFWRLALAAGDLLHRATGGDRPILLQDVIGLAFPRILVAVLDQEPIGALLAAAIAHAHQHPAAVQLVALQRELQVALFETAFGVLGFPITAIPELHSAAAILAFGNGAFEIAVVERMVLDFHRQALVMRIERGPPGDRPGFEHAVKFQPEIVVQARSGMLLDHEAALLRRPDRGFAARLRGLFEIPLFAVGGEVSQRHGKTPGVREASQKHVFRNRNLRRSSKFRQL